MSWSGGGCGREAWQGQLSKPRDAQGSAEVWEHAGRGVRGEEENCGILEGKESLRETPWYGMVLGRGSAGAGGLQEQVP